MSRVLAVTIILLSAPIAAGAQAYATDRSSWLVDGSAGYTRMSVEASTYETRSNQVSLAPSLQYFVVPGFAVGLSLDYRTADNTHTPDGSPSQSLTFTSTGVGPTLSYYHGTADQKVLPFVSGTYTFQNWKVDAQTTDDERKTRSVEVAVGVLLLMADHVGLTAEVFIRDGNVEDQDGVESNENLSGFRVGIAAFVF